MRSRLTLASGAASVFYATAVRAEQLDNPRTDYTAYTRPSGVLAVGPLKVEHGIIDEIMVGTYVPPWFAFPWLEVPIPSVYAKFRTSWWDPITLSLRGDIAYFDAKAVFELTDGDSNVNALSTTADVAISWLISKPFSASLALDYARLRAVGDASGETTTVEGASAAHTYSIRAFGEWRLSRVFAVTLLGRYLIYQSPASVNATSESDPATVEGDLSVDTVSQARFTIVPGASLVFKHWEVSAGVGYGVLYLPVLGLARDDAGLVADLGAAWRFDLY